MQNNTAKFTGKPLEDSQTMPSQEKLPKKSGLLKRIMPAFAAMGIMGALCVMLVQPAAADMNLSFVGTLFTSLFEALTTIITPAETFMDAAFPVIIKITIYAAIIGIIAAMLLFGRQILTKVANMIGF